MLKLDVKNTELLAPAGDFEKLKIAVEYGADAVYMGGQVLGLRAKAKNFSLNEMRAGIQYAHDRKCKAYITANIFAHNEDLDGAYEYFKELYRMGADGLIISDPGIFDIAKNAVPQMDIHISTQANVTNYQSVMFWKKLGAKRIVLARELSIEQIKEIRLKESKEGCDRIELEVFVHGAMCISYSGRCLLSNYMSGRDSNRGECSHPCRWKYYLSEEKRDGEYMRITEDSRGTYIFNSKDLCMVGHLPELIEAGVCSFKIEGRMKSPYYVGVTVRAYRQAIDDFFKSRELYEGNIQSYYDELQKASHRNFTKGFYFKKPDSDSQNYNSSSYIRTYDFVGVVVAYNEDTCFAVIEQRNKFSVGDELEVFSVNGEDFRQVVREMYDQSGNPVSSAPHAQQLLNVRMIKPVKPFDMLRKCVVQC